MEIVMKTISPRKKELWPKPIHGIYDYRTKRFEGIQGFNARRGECSVDMYNKPKLEHTNMSMTFKKDVAAAHSLPMNLIRASRKRLS